MTTQFLTRFMFAVLIATFCAALSAQQFTINGKVFDGTNGEALPGASIHLKGITSVGTTSDKEGAFSIKASQGETLVFNYMGFQTLECLVTEERKNLTVRLSETGKGQQFLPYLKTPYTTSSDTIPNSWEWVNGINPKESHETAQSMYWEAMRKKEYGQVIKAIVYRMQSQLQLEEVVTVAWLDSLKQDVARLPQPAKSVVYSLMADVYRAYYQQNKSKIRQRTHTSVSGDDIETWDISRLFEEALHCFKLSITDEKILQQTPISEYSDVLLYFFGTENQPPVLPTLYDLLVFRAIQAYTGELSVALPQQAFVINRPAYISDARAFVDYPLPSIDTLSAEYQVISLYQKLLRFRLQQPNDASNRYALINIDLERLRYVQDKGKYADSDRLFEKALKERIDHYQSYTEKNYPMVALAMLYKNQAARWRKNITDDVRGKYIEAFQLCEQIVASSDDSMTVRNAKSIQDEIKKSSATLDVSYLHYPNTPILAHLTYRNIKKLYLYVFQLNEEETVAYNRYLSEFKVEGAHLFRQQVIDLPSQPDYQQYTAEIKIDALPQGNYVALVSDMPDLPKDNLRNPDGKIMASALLQVSSLGVAVSSGSKNLNRLWGDEFTANNRAGRTIMEIVLTNNKTGQPVKDCEIDSYCVSNNGSTNFAESYKTDKNGMAYILNDCGQSLFMKFVAKQGNDRLVFFGNFATLPGNIPAQQDAVFFTDRSIYRPGQTVYFKTLCFNDKQLSADLELTVDFLDVNRKTIASQTFTTNEYGTVQGSFVIPQGLLNGSMSLVCYTNRIRGLASTPIRVEEYKRPTFELVYDPVEGNSRLNDTVRVSGKATAFAGYTIDNAQVKYRVVRNEINRYRYWWRPPMPLSPRREIVSETTVTGSDGSFSIAFKAEADDVRNDEQIFQYTVTADVTDANGETRSATKIVNVSAKPLFVEIGVPQKIVQRDNFDFDLKTTNLNGDFTPANLTVTLHALKSPERILHDRQWSAPDTTTLTRTDFEKSFPFDAYYDDDNPETYSVVRQLATFQLNTAVDKILRLPVLKSAKAGWYRLDFEASTTDNIRVKDRLFFRITSSPNGQYAPITHLNDWLTVVKNTYEPGENMEFYLAGGYANSFINYEIIVGNRVVDQQCIHTGLTPQRLIIPVKEDYRGGVTVQFVMMQNQRVYNQTAHIIVPYTNKKLDVAFTTFRDKLQPGEHEKWTLSVKDMQGQKQLAEMAATLYDASLDVFLKHEWADFSRFYPQRHGYFQWRMPKPWSSSYIYYWDRSVASIQRPVLPLIPVFPTFKSALEEVVITAFARQRSIEVTELSENLVVPSTSIAETLGGRIAGLVTMQDGQQRSLDNFFVRGTGDTSNKNALIIIDGKEDNANLFSLLKPEDIESFKVMNSTEAVAVYGARGANGVIIVTTYAGQLRQVATRKNFDETAFFYPQLRADENGEIAIEYTVPEALTRWKMLGFAHTKDFKIGNITGELITQKQVAISANAPRFFREGDVMEFTAKVNNIADSDLTGQALLSLYDAATMQPLPSPQEVFLSPQTQDFNVKAGESVGIRWKIAVPSTVQAITYKVTARSGNHTDGEEKTIPNLSNTLLVTETMPFSVRAGVAKTFTFKNMKDNTSTTLRNHKLTLELTSNPAWYAIQALPYMMEYPFECAEQLFSRFYANSLATNIANSSPRIKEVFDLWKSLPEAKDALLSNLEKNQELKQVLLEETPWVMQAQSETERKKRVGLLFDLNRMSYEQQNAFDKLQKMQLSEGGFPWFAGLPASRFITQHIVTGIGHLQALNALDNEFTAKANLIAGKALDYLDACVREDYNKLLKTDKLDLNLRNINHTQLHYLYACSFTQHKLNNDAFTYYYNQAARYWKDFNLYGQAMIALTLHRYGDRQKATDIIRWIKGLAQQSEEMGMYWRDNKAGYFWHQAPIETQALLIEAFNEITNDAKAVEEMKIWLLRNKQTNDWRTTKATAEACFALLKTGSNLLDESLPLDIKIGGSPLASVAREEIRPEPGTGYVKTAWSNTDILKEMAVLEANNPNKNGIAWGGVYWQYFEHVDKIEASEKGNLQMNKQLFLKQITERGAELRPLNGQNTLKTGDLVTVRMELKADRDYEFVHLKDMRAASLEPITTLSGYRYQDGLFYYENIKDASTNFFFSFLPKGTYVFEYELRVTHAGEFSNGITTFQCMYAPEFSAHSEGMRIKVAPNTY